MDPRDLEFLGDADMAQADPNSDDEDSEYDEGNDFAFDDEIMAESEHLKALEEHAEHEAKFGHIKLKEVNEIDTSHALAAVQAKKPKAKGIYILCHVIFFMKLILR